MTKICREDILLTCFYNPTEERCDPSWSCQWSTKENVGPRKPSSMTDIVGHFVIGLSSILNSGFIKEPHKSLVRRPRREAHKCVYLL